MHVIPEPERLPKRIYSQFDVCELIFIIFVLHWYRPNCIWALVSANLVCLGVCLTFLLYFHFTPVIPQ